ncbi:MAG: rhodanese-like domain-containing protein [Bacteroidales bacterium]|nr:rhodanese-like domain-containing protein [Bacteroidales bacterium]
MNTAPIKKRYYFISALVIILGIILLFLPFNKNRNQLSAEKLLLSITNNDRFFSTDEVAKFIISGDPSYQLIDVRSEEEYAKFSLPGAINIPLSKILNKDKSGYYEWEGYLNQKVKTNIFYSNGSIYANQAWMLTKRLNYPNNYVMKGGLNEWVETILKPKQPEASASQSALNQYDFRIAASTYFGGGSNISADSSDKSNTKNNTTSAKKKKKKSADGGC